MHINTYHVNAGLSQNPHLDKNAPKELCVLEAESS